MNRKITAKLRDHLQANTAGRGHGFGYQHKRECLHRSVLSHTGANRVSLGTNSGAEAGVFHVATGNNRAVFEQKGRADFKSRIRSVRVLAGRKSGGESLL